MTAKSEPKKSAKSDGQWYRAIKPGTLASGKFVKADEKFQLGDGDVFSDRWMEKTDAPPALAEPAPDAEEEQAKAVREHEEADRIRRGKFSLRSVPRSEEGEKEHQERVKAEQRELAARNPAPAGRAASANPSIVDPNALRKSK